jgi:PCRF domain
MPLLLLLLFPQRGCGTVATAAATATTVAWGVVLPRNGRGGAMVRRNRATWARTGNNYHYHHHHPQCSALYHGAWVSRLAVLSRHHPLRVQPLSFMSFRSSTTTTLEAIRNAPENNNRATSDTTDTTTTTTTTATTVESSSSSLFEWESALLEAKRDLELASLLYAHNVESAGVTVSQLDARILDYEREQAADANFWSDVNAQRAALVHEQWSRDSQLRARLQNWQQWHGDAHTALEMLNNDDASLSRDEQEMLLQELQTSVQLLLSDGQNAELEWLLSGPYDHCAARLTITAGAGGTEANDWVSDLYRMYTRYVQQRSNKDGGGWTCQLLDATPGDVVGYKSVELLVTGPYAYGWLHAEKGAHRLVRLSPFNAKDKRQTMSRLKFPRPK